MSCGDIGGRWTDTHIFSSIMASCVLLLWVVHEGGINQNIPNHSQGAGFSAICECLCFCDLLLRQRSEFLGPGPASAVCIDSSARSWVALSSLCAEIPTSHSHASKKFYCILGKRKRTKQNNFPNPSSVEPHCSIGWICLDNFYPLFFSLRVKLFDPNNCRLHGTEIINF